MENEREREREGERERDLAKEKICIFCMMIKLGVQEYL